MNERENINASDAPQPESLPPLFIVGDSASGLLLARLLSDMGLEPALVKTGASRTGLHCGLPGSEVKAVMESLENHLSAAHVREIEGWEPCWAQSAASPSVSARGDLVSEACVFVTPSASPPDLPAELPSGCEALVYDTLSSPGVDIAFLLDYGPLTAPAVGMSAIAQAVENVLAGGRSWVVFRHVPVAHKFGETLLDRAKRAGVEFLRFGDALPRVAGPDQDHASTAGFEVKLTDHIEAGQEAAITSDRLIVATSFQSPELETGVGACLPIERDDWGFLLSASVHSHSGRSFRQGMFSVGESTGNADLLSALPQAAAAAAEARAWMIDATARTKSAPVSVSDECIRCLTCLRICPHGAITLAPGQARSSIVINGARCRECGLCVAECPRQALDLASFPESGMASMIGDIRGQADNDCVVVFGCERSPGRALRGTSLPANVVFISVPCVGRVSEAAIWASLSAGARGVLVVGCHPGNCASNTGTVWADDRVACASNILQFPIMSQGRVAYTTCAANETARLEHLVRNFCDSLPRPASGHQGEA